MNIDILTVINIDVHIITTHVRITTDIRISDVVGSVTGIGRDIIIGLGGRGIISCSCAVSCCVLCC
jgi:hypothetical protein